MKKDQSKKVIGLWLSLVVFMMGLGLQVQVKTAHGAGAYSFSDAETATKMTGTQYIFSGNAMVYFDFDKNYKRQVFYQDLTTGEKKQLTTDPAFKDSLAFNGDMIVWEDKRNIRIDSYETDIYSYSLKTGVEKKLNTLTGQLVKPTIDANDVVWYDLNTTAANIYVYNIATMQVKLLGHGRYPILAQGKVLTKNAMDGGLSLIDVATGAVREVLKLDYSIYVNSFAFNGKFAVWEQTNLDHKSYFRQMDVSDPAGNPVDLTTPSVKTREFASMSINNNEAVWLEDKGGVGQIMGVHLATKEPYPVTQGKSDQELQGFQGDQLVMKSAGGNLVFRNIIRTEVITPIGGDSTNTQPGLPGDTSTNGFPISTPTPTPTHEPTEGSFQKQLDAQGGQLSAKNDTVTLTVPQNAFMESSLVSLIKHEELQKDYIKKLPAQKRFLSAPWEIQTKRDFLKPVQLILPYDTTKVNVQQLKKLGVFQIDEKSGKWNFVSGVTDSATGLVTAQLKHAGTYAVMLNEVSFKDISGHWAQQGIEIAASRGIVNGMTDTTFLPNAPLTRAQFTKILVSSMEIDLLKTSTSSFQDVSANYWGKSWIDAAVKEGLVQGANGQFQSDAKLSREQMFVMLTRAMHAEDQAKALKESEIDSLLKATDKNQISSWARPYAALVLKLGLITGDAKGAILPTQSSTRAQAVIVINKLLINQKKM
jgi:hypothetical protein